MRKEVKRDGNSFKIRLDAEDMRVYGLQSGDIVDIALVKVGATPSDKSKSEVHHEGNKR
jgi:hypothetical protein